MNWEEYLRALHFTIHAQVRQDLLKKSSAELSVIAAQGNGDVSYAIDAQPERIVDDFLTSNPPEGGAVVVCEGLGERAYPVGANPDEVAYRILVDPLDGTREIMYDKRSCWILTGVAQNRGSQTAMGDIFVSVQTEVPPSCQDRSLVLTARRGCGAYASVWDVANNVCLQPPRPMRTSDAKDLRHGFAVFVNFFPGMKEWISRIEEDVLRVHLGPVEENRAATFTDQYISTAGQLYLLASGRYRLVADFRSRFGELMAAQGAKLSLCCHPYDLSTYLILTESGGILTDASGAMLDDPMDLDTNCSWFGYANRALYDAISPLLTRAMDKLKVWVTLQKSAARLGLSRDDTVMETGEARFRMTLGDGSGTILCECGERGYWQNAHYHESTTELICVQHGMVAYISESKCGDALALYPAGSSFRIDKRVHHNVYMFPNSITYTVKLTEDAQKDWHAAPELDTRSKALTESEVLLRAQ
jgi:hypothetical protein